MSDEDAARIVAAIRELLAAFASARLPPPQIRLPEESRISLEEAVRTLPVEYILPAPRLTPEDLLRLYEATDEP